MHIHRGTCILHTAFHYGHLGHHRLYNQITSSILYSHPRGFKIKYTHTHPNTVFLSSNSPLAPGKVTGLVLSLASVLRHTERRSSGGVKSARRSEGNGFSRQHIIRRSAHPQDGGRTSGCGKRRRVDELCDVHSRKECRRSAKDNCFLGS